MAKENMLQQQPFSGSIPSDILASVLPHNKLEESVVKSAAAQRVVNDPLPGPVLQAIADVPLEVKTSKGIVTVRPVVSYDFTVFKLLNSPFFRMMIEAANQEKTKEDEHYSDEDAFEMIFQFTRPCKEIRAILKKGIEFYKETAMSEIADKYNMADIGLVVRGVVEQFRMSFATLVSHDTEATSPVIEENDKKK